ATPSDCFAILQVLLAAEALAGAVGCGENRFPARRGGVSGWGRLVERGVCGFHIPTGQRPVLPVIHEASTGFPPAVNGLSTSCPQPANSPDYPPFEICAWSSFNVAARLGSVASWLLIFS